jgi:hypothetical protein
MLNSLYTFIELKTYDEEGLKILRGDITSITLQTPILTLILLQEKDEIANRSVLMNYDNFLLCVFYDNYSCHHGH